MSTKTSIELILAGAALLAHAGCGYDRSLADRNTLDGHAEIASLSGKAAGDIPTSAGASVRSLERLEWQPIDVIVPVDGTVHGPTWRIDVVTTDPNARQRSLHPTLSSAMQLGSGSRGQLLEGVISPFVAFGNVLAMPVFLFTDPPGSVMSPSRTMLYKRTQPGRTVAGPIPVDDGQAGTSTEPAANTPAENDSHEQ